jgi:hypothetical protein
MTWARYQPRGRVLIDWSNPITQGLTFAYVHGESGANGYGLAGVLNIPYSGATAKEMPTGFGARSTSASSRAYQIGSHGLTTTNYSLFAVGNATSNAITQSAIDADNSSPRYFQFRLNGGKLEFIPFNTSAGVTGQPVFATALTATELARGFTMGATASPTRTAAFQNGQIATATPSNLIAPTAGFFLSIGARATGAQGWTTGGLSMVAGWSRTLSDAEMLSLGANPWQLFLDADDEDVFVGSAAAPAGVTGGLTATLGGLGLAAAASASVSGAASIALSAITAAGNGAVAESGVLTSMLGAATLNASGTVAAAGTMTATLGPASMSGAGAVATGAAQATTLGQATLAASGFAQASGMLSKTLATMTLAGVGFVDSGSGQNGGAGVDGQLAGQLQPLALASVGSAPVHGQAVIVLGGLSAASAGGVATQGQTTAALGALSVAAYGGVPVTGSLQVTLGALTLAATAGMFVFTRSQARAYVIAPENRRYTIASENRTYRIEP